MKYVIIIIILVVPVFSSAAMKVPGNLPDLPPLHQIPTGTLPNIKGNINSGPEYEVLRQEAAIYQIDESTSSGSLQNIDAIPAQAENTGKNGFLGGLLLAVFAVGAILYVKYRKRTKE